MDFFFGLITLLIPIFGIFTTRLYYNAWNRQLLFYIPIFWFFPFSIIPSILVWLGKFKKNPTKLSKNVIAIIFLIIIYIIALIGLIIYLIWENKAAIAAAAAMTVGGPAAAMAAKSAVQLAEGKSLSSIVGNNVSDLTGDIPGSDILGDAAKNLIEGKDVKSIVNESSNKLISDVSKDLNINPNISQLANVGVNLSTNTINNPINTINNPINTINNPINNLSKPTFEQLDKNKDNYITTDEILPPFNSLDKNSDGFITKDEIN